MALTAAAETGGSADADGAPRMAKFLCSFGGAILPRPLDGRLRYVGGKTRIVMLPRDISYFDLAARMRELFEDADIIKYKQPDEDLDGLVSVVNDDDVVNMMDENDKLIAAGKGFTRLRIFLFSHHLDDGAASAAVGYNADERETERRYVDALNSLCDVRSPSSPVSVGQQGGLQFSSSSSSSSSSSRGLTYTSRDNTTEGKLHNVDMEPTSLTMRILRKITNNFSEERALGQGAYGKVYRGVYDDGQEIAVKLLYNNMQAIDDDQFIREFDNLMMLKHPNIVRLVGYCYETRRQHMDFKGRTVFGETTYRALCFEYMHKGSLQKHLSDECDGPDWHTRYKIIKGTCEGLKYLHEGLKEPFYHLDLKPDNILLDEDMVPKLADFGLSKIFGDEQTRVTKSAIGTIGYMPPEYLFGSIVSKKLDIFSLGVVITKIIAGPRGHTRSAEMSYQEFLDQVQENWRSRLVEKWSSPEPLEAHCQQVNKCAEMALRCIEMDRNKRPSIVDIIHELNETEIVIDKAMSGSFNLMAEFGISRAIQGSLWAERQNYDEFPKAPMFDMSELEILFSAGLRNSEATDKSASHVSEPKPEKIHLRAILTLDDAVLDADKVDLLIKFTPTKEEIELLKGYKGDKQVLGECEKDSLGEITQPGHIYTHNHQQATPFRKEPSSSYNVEANRNTFPHYAQDPNDRHAEQIYHGSTSNQDIVASTNYFEETAGHREVRLDDDSQFYRPDQGYSADGDPLPGIEGFQIVGDPRPGITLRACGFCTNGTTLCNFQWVRYLEDGTRQFIEGATMYDYVVTADDVGTLLAVVCTPMDDNGRQGDLVREFANNQNMITCDQDMQSDIDTCISRGRVDFDVFILRYSPDGWEEAMLMLRRTSYQVTLKHKDEVIIEEKYSPNLQTKVPNGRTTLFVLVSSTGVNLPFNTQGLTKPNNENDVRLRDLIVLVMRTFQAKALDAKRKGVLFLCRGERSC